MTTTELQTTGAMEFRITDPVDFIQAIHFNKDELMEAIKARVARYEGVTYTANTIKQAKSDRAELNKLIKAIEDKRKEIKKQLLQPYEDFEAEVKELLEIIKEPTEMIDKQVKDYEKQQKEFKKSQLKAKFDEDGDAKYLSGKVKFEDVFEERYLNVSVTLSSAWYEIKEKLEKIRKDVELIESDTSVYKHTLMSLYMSTHDITRVMTEKKKYEELEAAEEKRKAEEAAAEEKRKAEEAERQRAEDEAIAKSEAEKDTEGIECRTPQEADQKASAVTQKSVEPGSSADAEKIFPAAFRVCGTKAQLAALVKFMNANSINWQQIPTSAIKTSGTAA